MKVCKYCGKAGFENNHSLSAHRQYNLICFDKWKKDQEIEELNKCQSRIPCEICGKLLKNISNTHLRSHNLTMKQYKEKYPNSNLFSKELLKIQLDKREKTIHTKYTPDEIKYFKGIKAHDSTFQKYGKTVEQLQAEDRLLNPEKWKLAAQKTGNGIKEFYKNLRDKPEEHRLHVDKRIEKLKKTNQRLYNVDYITQTNFQKEKSKTTNLKNCGYEYWPQSPEGKETSRINSIKYTETQKLNGEPLCPRIGDMERPCLNELEPFTPNKKIIRNSHDYAFTCGRFPDGEVEGLPIFIQFNECHHYLDKYSMKIENQETIDTTMDLASNKIVGPRIVFNISEIDWIHGKEKVIEQFKILIDCFVK